VGIAQVVAHKTGESILCVRGGYAALHKLVGGTGLVIFLSNINLKSFRSTVWSELLLSCTAFQYVYFVTSSSGFGVSRPTNA